MAVILLFILRIFKLFYFYDFRATMLQLYVYCKCNIKLYSKIFMLIIKILFFFDYYNTNLFNLC
jgi:hypothetical protein